MLYVSFQAEAAIAEVFGRYPVWSESIFRRADGRVYALATLEAADNLSIYSMDDAAHLMQLQIRPSDVITRDRSRTRRWARTVYDWRTKDGIAWWSFYNPAWSVAGLWQTAALEVASLQRLDLSNPLVELAAETIVRKIERKVSPLRRRARRS